MTSRVGIRSETCGNEREQNMPTQRHILEETRMRNSIFFQIAQPAPVTIQIFIQKLNIKNTA